MKRLAHSTSERRERSSARSESNTSIKPRPVKRSEMIFPERSHRRISEAYRVIRRSERAEAR
jgi:hypothetical protein